MSFILQPWQVVFVAMSGWVNQRQQQVIEFQNAEIEALLKKLGKKRVLLTEDQRRLLAVKGKALGRRAPLSATTFWTFLCEFSPFSCGAVISAIYPTQMGHLKSLDQYSQSRRPCSEEIGRAT